MSNLYRSSKIVKPKKIQVKPIDKPSNENQSNDLTHEELDQLAKEKVAQAEEQLNQAKQQANQLIEEANQRITEEREHFEKEKEQAYNDASKQGYEDGYKNGEISGKASYEQLVEQAQDMVTIAKQDYEEKVQSSEQTIIRIALNAAEKIVSKKLEEEPHIFIDLVTETLEEVFDQPEIKIYVHVKQYNELINHKEQLQSHLNHQTNLVIYPKKDLSEYDCIVETELGQIDTSIDTRLNQLKQVLQDEMG
ncbi:flagellar assembly protein FliH [Alkalibacillus silvisoli]|uniref:Flagellar assembly protein FliH n=1 Tax=Alkalibacillus silvisoli TaxID=392823 RepID=A0ABN0ZWE3_9BACI